jgi:hypothetical protein
MFFEKVFSRTDVSTDPIVFTVMDAQGGTGSVLKP